MSGSLASMSMPLFCAASSPSSFLLSRLVMEGPSWGPAHDRKFTHSGPDQQGTCAAGATRDGSSFEQAFKVVIY